MSQPSRLTSIFLFTLGVGMMHSNLSWAAKAPRFSTGFDLPSISGKAAVPFAKARKKVTLINFWASWCGPCLTELPSLGELWKAYSAQGKAFEVILINIDDDPKEEAVATLPKLKLPFSSYWDEGGKLQKLFDVTAVPYTVILSQDNKTLFEDKNTREWNTPEIRKKLDAWLK